MRGLPSRTGSLKQIGGDGVRLDGLKEVPILSRLCVSIPWSVSKRTALEMRGPGRFSLAE